jgi:lyso-ornithine lipid O-acyltransferase
MANATQAGPESHIIMAKHLALAVKVCGKVTTIILATLILLPVLLVALALDHKLKVIVPVWWHRIVCRILGIRVIVHGDPALARPLLLVSNHVSWTDINVLGTVKPLSFIAKSEVKDWPVFGWLARLQRTVFIDRNRKRDAGRQAQMIANRLVHQRDVIVLFAEGTTSDGTHLLPFKSSLTGAADLARSAEGTTAIQPVALAYTRQGGLPLGLARRIETSWIGDVELMPHLMWLLKAPPIDVEVLFGEPIIVEGPLNRQAVTAACARSIGNMLAAVQRGTEPDVHSQTTKSLTEHNTELAEIETHG